MAQLACILLLVATSTQPPLKNDDRVVFVGDDLTQQMFYTRATATALLSLHPTGAMRFYNGGRDGATAGQAVGWIDELFELTDPTVVVLAFGLADAAVDDAEAFELHLSNLIANVRQFPRVRQVIVLSPPALPKQTGPKIEAFCKVAQQVAQTEGVAFTDIYHPMRQLYDEADDALFEQLKLGDQLPSELMHLVIASHLLAGVGVTGEQMASVDFAPLSPVQMGQIREHLAWQTPAVAVEAAGSSSGGRALYLALARHEALFFRLWRLPDEPSASALGRRLAEAWAVVAGHAAGFAGVEDHEAK